MASRVIVNDGTTIVQVSSEATNKLSIVFQDASASNVIRTLNGQAIKQVPWQKDQIQIQASGPLPPELEAIDWCVKITLSIATESCSPTDYTVHCDPPVENWNHSKQTVSWSLQCWLVDPY